VTRLKLQGHNPLKLTVIIINQTKLAPLKGGWGAEYTGKLYLWHIKIQQAMESTRQKKVSRLIQKELADIFLRRGNEFAHGKMVSITRVRVSPDLSFAKVYISIFPATGQEDILKSMKEHSSKFRFDLGQKVRTQLRIVPDIAFHIDDSLDYIDKIDKLLKS
jgi:ribosome-binding factor A